MNLKHSLTRIGSAAFLAATAPAIALAQTAGNPFTRASTDVGVVQGGALGGSTAPQNLYTIAGNIINVALGFLGLVLLGYMLYAGYLWMTSGGAEEKAKQARTMIANAIIGLIIIVAAFAISNFVLGSLVNVTR